MFAPDAQIKVPVLLWSGDSSDIDYEKTLKLKNQPNSHDALFPTLLQIFEIHTDLHHQHEQPLIYLKHDDTI
jgi:glucan phosphoethanolaminetransferase (alkaline phosphatase superfamily)